MNKFLILLLLLTTNSVFSQELYKEIINSNTITCVSNGEGKAKGLKFLFKYPKSLTEEVTQRPNIVKHVSSKTADIQFMVMVKKADYILSKSDKAELLSYDYINSMISNEGIKIDNIVTNQKIDGENCTSFITNTSVKRLDFSIKVKTLTYMLYYEDYQVVLSFMVSPDSEIEEFYSKYEKSFKLMASSFVITSKWE